MHRSTQSGQVSIWLTVLIILALIAMAALYTTYSWVQKQESDLARLNKQKNLYEERTRQLEEDIQGWEKVVGESKTEAIQRVKQADLAPPSDNLRGIHDQLLLERNKTQMLAESVKANLDQAVAARKQAQEELEVVRGTKEEELAKAKQRLNDIQGQARTAESSFQQQAGELRSKISKLEQDYRREREAFEEVKRKMTFDLDTIREKSRLIVERLRMAKGAHPDIDGHIVYNDSPRRMVSIDLGSDEGVKPGMVFRVYRFTRTGERIDKGRIRVRTVERNSATATIISAIGIEMEKALAGAEEEEEEEVSTEVTYLVRPFKPRPIVEGDYIESIFFPSGGNFIVIGNFNNVRFSSHEKDFRYDKIELVELVKRYGGQVQTEVTLDTNYSVEGTRDLGDPVSEKVFSELREFRVQTIPVRDFLFYLPD